MLGESNVEGSGGWRWKPGPSEDQQGKPNSSNTLRFLHKFNSKATRG